MVQDLLSREDVELGRYAHYEVFHICSCGRVYSHAQSDCDIHRLCPLPHFTYPVEVLRIFLQIWHNYQTLKRIPNPNIIRDFVAASCHNRRIYKTYQQALLKTTEPVGKLFWIYEKIYAKKEGK